MLGVCERRGFICRVCVLLKCVSVRAQLTDDTLNFSFLSFFKFFSFVGRVE